VGGRPTGVPHRIPRWGPHKGFLPWGSPSALPQRGPTKGVHRGVSDVRGPPNSVLRGLSADGVTSGTPKGAAVCWPKMSRVGGSPRGRPSGFPL
jgi:hypothetical protein